MKATTCFLHWNPHSQMNMDGFTWLKFVCLVAACCVFIVPVLLLLVRAVVAYALWVEDTIEQIQMNWDAKKRKKLK